MNKEENYICRFCKGPSASFNCPCEKLKGNLWDKKVRKQLNKEGEKNEFY